MEWLKSRTYSWFIFELATELKNKFLVLFYQVLEDVDLVEKLLVIVFELGLVNGMFGVFLFKLG